jgi:hypothetical protein
MNWQPLQQPSERRSKRLEKQNLKKEDKVRPTCEMMYVYLKSFFSAMLH